MNRIAELIAEKLEIITNLEELPHRETMSQLSISIRDLSDRERFRTLKLENEFKSFIKTLDSREISEMYEEDEDETLEALREAWESIEQESMLLSEELIDKYEDEEGEEDGDEEEKEKESGEEGESDETEEEQEFEDEEEDNEYEKNDESFDNNKTELEQESEYGGKSALEEDDEIKQNITTQETPISPEEARRLMLKKIDTVLRKTGGKITRQDLSKITGKKIDTNEVIIREFGIRLVSSFLNPDMFTAKKL